MTSQQNSKRECEEKTTSWSCGKFLWHSKAVNKYLLHTYYWRTCERPWATVGPSLGFLFCCSFKSWMLKHQSTGSAYRSWEGLGRDLLRSSTANFAHAGTDRAGCPGLCLAGLWIPWILHSISA